MWYLLACAQTDTSFEGFGTAFQEDIRKIDKDVKVWSYKMMYKIFFVFYKI